MMENKRWREPFLLTALVFIILAFCGCREPVKIDEQPNEEPTQEQTEQVQAENTNYGVSVNFIDVGLGEAIFIYFPDGKTMLVDCGNNDASAQKIIDFIKGFEVSVIDYMVLTHPDIEHIGGAEKILNTLTVKKIYAPKILDEIHGGMFVSYENAKKVAVEKEIEFTVSDYYDYMCGEDYSVAFLSPLYKKGIYKEFNGTESPSAEQVNDLSPIIYVEIKGVRFILTGDAGKGQEQTVLENHGVNMYENFYNGTGVELDFNQIDFLKLSNGGAEEGTSEEFLQLISPRNAVVFAGAGVVPNTITLRRISIENEFYNLYRTDVYGTVTVKIIDEKQYDVITDND